MEDVVQLKLRISRQLSTGSILKKIGHFSFHLQSSLSPRLSSTNRFIFGRQARAPSPKRRRLISQRSLRFFIREVRRCSQFKDDTAHGDLERKMKKEQKKLEYVGSR